MPAGTARAAPYASSASDDEASALAFIVERGYEPRLASAVIATLKDPSGWGARDGELLKTVEQLAGAWEIGADAGLGALAAAVEREMAETAGKAPVSVVIYPASGERPFTVSALEGQTLRDVCESGVDGGARILREYLECACSGVMACSTCHVYVREGWFDPANAGDSGGKLGPASEEEQDMLDLAFEPNERSRLGCQIVLSREKDGLEVSLPPGAHNLFDEFGGDRDL